MPAPPEGFRPKCTRCGGERVELRPVCLDCPEVARPAASEVTRAAEHITSQDAGWKEYNATNRAAVTCARAILAGQGAGLTEEERAVVTAAQAFEKAATAYRKALRRSVVGECTGPLVDAQQEACEALLRAVRALPVSP